MKKILSTAILAIAGLFASAAHASVLQYGVYNDVAVTTVTNNWGFTECFSNRYGDYGANISSILSGCQGDYLMLAARRVGSDVFDVLAAANFNDVIFNTGDYNNVTHSANGVEWYFSNDYSWGFAGAGDTVSRNSCDTNGSAWSGTPERDRLCWHTGGGSLEGGWRSGDNIDLNGANDWERVLLVGNAQSVPEPATIALLGLGLAGFAVSRRQTARNKKA